jgi:hypothetical protein
MIPRMQPSTRKSENSCDLAAAGPGRLLLLLAVVMTLSGMLAISLRGGGSSFNSWLFLDLGLSDRSAKGMERFVLLLSMAMTAVPIWLPEKRKCLFFLVPAFLFLLAESFLTARMGGMGYANWAPSAYALRYATPLALMMFLFQAPFGGAQAGSLLRIALALVFLTHGAEAFLHHPRFVDLIINSASNLLGWRIEEAAAKTILSWIGVMDMTLAIAVVIRPFRTLLWWMAVWGLITALARLTANGWGAYPELLLRTTHFVVPFVLLKFRAESETENDSSR